MTWLPVVILLLISVAITVGLLRGGRFGGRWYTGGRSWGDRDNDGRPVDRTDNVSSAQWGGTTLDD